MLDNAIEACEMLEEKERFIRIYIEIVKQQLYMSFTNAAMEDLNFNQKSYISEKRGNHGHEMCIRDSHHPDFASGKDHAAGG